MKKTLILLVSCMSIYALEAQENLKNEVIDVVKHFRPKVMQAAKIKSQPVFIDTSKVSENLNYSIRFEEFRVQQHTDSLAALVMLRPDLETLFTKHIDLGLGTLLNPHVSVDLSSGRHTKQFYRTYFNYHGAYASHLPNEDQHSILKLGASHKQIFNAFVWQSNLYLNDFYRFDAANQRFHNSALHVNSALQLTDSFSVWLPSDIELNAMGFFQESNFEERLFSIKSRHQGTHHTLKNWTFANALLVQQSLAENYRQWQSQVGSKMSFNLAQVQLAIAMNVLQSDVKLIPDVRVQYQLIEKGLYSSFELGGNRSLYTLRDLYTNNPYLEAISIEENHSERLPSNTKYFTRLGLNGNLFSGVSYQVSAAAVSQDYFMHFVHQSDASEAIWMAPAFTPLKSFELHAALDAQWTETLHFSFKADLKSFNKELSYIPKLELGWYGSYHYNEQWYMSGSLRYIGQRQALRSESSDFTRQQNLDAFMDVNVKLHFAYHEHLGFYVEGINLMNQETILWQQTPVLGRQLNLGASYRF